MRTFLLIAVVLVSGSCAAEGDQPGRGPAAQAKPPDTSRAGQGIPAFIKQFDKPPTDDLRPLDLRLYTDGHGKLEQVMVYEQILEPAQIGEFLNSVLDPTDSPHGSARLKPTCLVISGGDNLQFHYVMNVLVIACAPPNGLPLASEIAFPPRSLEGYVDDEARRTSSMPDGADYAMSALNDAWKFAAEAPRAFRLLPAPELAKPPAATLRVDAQTGSDGTLTGVTVDGGARLDIAGSVLRDKVLAFADKADRPRCVSLRLPPTLNLGQAVNLCNIVTRDRIVGGRIVPLVDQFELSLVGSPAKSLLFAPVYNPELLPIADSIEMPPEDASPLREPQTD